MVENCSDFLWIDISIFFILSWAPSLKFRSTYGIMILMGLFQLLRPRIWEAMLRRACIISEFHQHSHGFDKTKQRCNPHLERKSMRKQKSENVSYPLVNIQKTMENRNFQWENSLEMTIFNSYVSHYQRVSAAPPAWVFLITKAL